MNDDTRNPRRRSSTPTGLTSFGNLVQRKGRVPAESYPKGTRPEAIQYDLWTTFYSADKESLSNTVELWDAIPKFAVHRNKQKSLRDKNGHLPLHEAEFVFQETKCRLEIQPALIREGKGTLSFYPSHDEELVWEILVKLFSNQHYGLHDIREKTPTSYVRFTLRLLQRELAQHGHKRSLQQVRHSIEVLSRSILILYVGDQQKPLYRAPILADVADVTRDDYFEDPKRSWVARLPALISSALASLDYRQYNYVQSLRFKDPLTRWFYKRLVHRFTNATLLDSHYHLALSTMEREGAPFYDEATSRQIKRVDSVLEEMAQAHLIYIVEKNVRRSSGQGRRIEDVVWKIAPLPSFVRESKAANGRLRDAKEQLSLVSSHRS